MQFTLLSSKKRFKNIRKLPKDVMQCSIMCVDVKDYDSKGMKVLGEEMVYQSIQHHYPEIKEAKLKKFKKELQL